MNLLTQKKQNILKGAFALFLLVAFCLPFLIVKAQDEPKSGEVNDRAIQILDFTAGGAKIIQTNPDGSIKTTPFTLREIIGSIVNILLGFVGLIYFILVVYGGIIWLTAGGDATKADKAISILSRSSLGIMVILFAFLVTNFILFRLIDFFTSK